MSTISKVFTVVNIALAMLLLGSVAAIVSEETDYRSLLNQEKEAREAQVADLESKLGDANAVRDAKAQEAEDRLDEVDAKEREIAALKTQLSDSNATNNENTKRMDAMATDYNKLAATMENLSSRRDELETAVDELTSERNDAVAAKNMAENAQATLEKNVESLESDVADLETRLTSVSEARDVLIAEQEALTSLGVNIPMLIGNNVPSIDAAVSDVGSNFVVLSVGEADGVKIGFPFDVYRGGTYIGRVVVDRLYPNNCIARVMMTNQGQSFQNNDKASTRL